MPSCDLLHDTPATHVFQVQQQLGPLSCDAFLVPRTDRSLSEYGPLCEERLRWLTGFTGSSGFCVVTCDRVFLVVDGRYSLQAQQEMEAQTYKVEILSQKDFSFNRILSPGSVIGYDPWLHSVAERDGWKKQYPLLTFQSLDTSPIDLLWKDRPPRPADPFFFLADRYTGENWQEKILRIQKDLVSMEADWLYLGAPDHISWLLNIRGRDFPYSPLVDSLGFLSQEGIVVLAIDPEKIPEEAAQLFGDQVMFLSFDQLGIWIGEQKGKFLLPSQQTPVWIAEQVEGGVRSSSYGPHPIALPKACKNLTEQQGMREAHILDGIAWVKLLMWLSSHIESVPLTELDVVHQLEEYRRQHPSYQGPSFPTIAGFGANGSIIHYHPTEKTNKQLIKDCLFLLDAGGQYWEGTTDVTRTLALGQPSSLHRQFYTRVLKGHIALAQAVFPHGTHGGQIDVLARQFLWQQGVDFDHGTGHGVGCFLNVHEGPQRISRWGGGGVSLVPGMVLSNEPGYYQDNDFGIRLENLMLVIESSFSGFYTFDPLTCIPFESSLIEEKDLTSSEKVWINRYHERVWKTLSPRLEEKEREWLLHATVNR